MTFGLAGGARLVLAGGGRGWLWVAAGGIALLLALRSRARSGGWSRDGRAWGCSGSGSWRCWC